MFLIFSLGRANVFAYRVLDVEFSSYFDGAFLFVTLSRRAPDLVTCDSFFGRRHSKAFAQNARALGGESGQHLQNRIGKPELENAARDCRKRRFVSQIDGVPALLGAVLEKI